MPTRAKPKHHWHRGIRIELCAEPGRESWWAIYSPGECATSYSIRVLSPMLGKARKFIDSMVWEHAMERINIGWEVADD